MQNEKFNKKMMQDICRFIEAHSDKPMKLEVLAKQVHMSPSHFQRQFKSAIGVSPKEYAASCRIKKLKSELRNNPDSVTAAIYDSGFQSMSRVYENLDKNLGMTPKQYRNSGKGTTISYASANTPLGCVIMAATDRGLCFIQFGENKKRLIEQLRSEYSKANVIAMSDAHKDQFAAWMKSLSDYLEGNLTTLDLPLDISGTAFQLKVWKFLQSIPAGGVISYKEVACAIGNPNAIRAVANACAKNSLAIAIPCHRVIRGNGDLAGYRWGIEKKRALLDLERKNRKNP